MTRTNRRRSLRLLTAGLAALAVAAPAAQAASDPGNGGAIAVAAAPSLPEDVHLHTSAHRGAQPADGVVLRRSAPPAIDGPAPVSPPTRSAARPSGDSVNLTAVGMVAATLVLLTAAALAVRGRRARLAL
jgi:hypothetical protein